MAEDITQEVEEAQATIEQDRPEPAPIQIRDDTLTLPMLAKIFTNSGMFPNVRSASQAVVKILAGRELGFGPVTSMNNIFIVRERIALGYPLVAAAIKRHPGYDYRVKTLTNERCELEFFQRAESGENEGEWESVGISTFTMDDAKQAGLLDRGMSRPGALAQQSAWKTYPRNLLFARALTNGARFFVPDVFMGGVYTPEEMA